MLGYRVWQRLFAGDRGVIGRHGDARGPAARDRRRDAAAVPLPHRRHGDVGRDQDNMSRMPRNGRFMVCVGRLKPGRRRRPPRRRKWTRSARSSTPRIPTRTRAGACGSRGVHDAMVGDTKSALMVLLGRGRLRAAHRLRERRQPAARAGDVRAGARSRSASRSAPAAAASSRSGSPRAWCCRLVGGVAGIALAYAAVQLVVAFGPAGVPRLDETAVDVPVLALTFGRRHARRRAPGARARRAHAAARFPRSADERRRRLHAGRSLHRRRRVDRVRGGAGDDARGGRRAAVHQFRAADGGEDRLRCRQRPQPEGVPHAAALRHGRRRQAVHPHRARAPRGHTRRRVGRGDLAVAARRSLVDATDRHRGTRHRSG